MIKIIIWTKSTTTTTTTNNNNNNSIYSDTSVADDMFRTKNKFYSTTVLGEKASQSASDRLRGVSMVDLYLQYGTNAVHFATDNVFKNMTDKLWGTFHNDTVSSNTCKYQVVIIELDIIPVRHNLKYPYTFKPRNTFPSTLDDILAPQCSLGFEINVSDRYPRPSQTKDVDNNS